METHKSYDSVNQFKVVGLAEEPVESFDEMKTVGTCSRAASGKSCIRW